MNFMKKLEDLVQRFQSELTTTGKDIQREVMDAFKSSFEEIKEDVESFLSSLKAYGTAHPEKLFRILRSVQPIFVWKQLAIVTRFEDVQEVLERDDVFDVPYAARMKEITDGENFFLGMPDGERYTRDHTNMMAIVRRADVDTWIKPKVNELAKACIEGKHGRIDAVSELARPVPAGMVSQYFGLEGVDQHALAEWASSLFWYLFLDQESQPDVHTRALDASKQLNAYLDGRIAARRAELASGAAPTDDIITRCLRLDPLLPGLSDRDIRNNLVGLIIGAIPTTATSAALALDQLLERPHELAGAHDAAVNGDHELLARYVFEAMRFRPMNPGIFRIVNRDFELARDQVRATWLRKGMTVMAATQSAMFDRLQLEAPDEFRLDRQPRDYLFWGYGLHTCFGQYINHVQIPGLLQPLLAKSGLRRAPGQEGQLTWAGPFAGSLVVLFDEERAPSSTAPRG